MPTASYRSYYYIRIKVSVPRVVDPDPDLCSQSPEVRIRIQNSKKNRDFYCFVISVVDPDPHQIER